MSLSITPPWSPPALAFKLASNVPIYVLTSVDGNQIVGKALTLREGALAGEIEGYVNGAMATVSRMFVDDRFREGAVGRGLFQTFSTVAAEKGARLLQVRTTTESVGFYERMGMRQVPNPSGMGILMEKTLPPPPPR